MTENTMQCCYTNAVQEVGGKISSGWQPVAVSDNIPSEAYNGCIMQMQQFRHLWSMNEGTFSISMKLPGMGPLYT